MKKLLIVFAVVLFTAGFATKVSAQAQLTGNIAGGEILAPIELIAGTPMEFGKMAVLTGGGTVTLTPDATGTLTAAGAITLVSGVAPTAASFTVNGTGTSGYTITKPMSITIKRGSNNETMTINPVSAKTNLGLGTLGSLSNGTGVFYLGGILTVPADQVPGLYSGTYTVSVNYN